MGLWEFERSVYIMHMIAFTNAGCKSHPVRFSHGGVDPILQVVRIPVELQYVLLSTP